MKFELKINGNIIKTDSEKVALEFIKAMTKEVPYTSPIPYTPYIPPVEPYLEPYRPYWVPPFIYDTGTTGSLPQHLITEQSFTNC